MYEGDKFAAVILHGYLVAGGKLATIDKEMVGKIFDVADMFSEESNKRARHHNDISAQDRTRQTDRD